MASKQEDEHPDDDDNNDERECIEIYEIECIRILHRNGRHHLFVQPMYI